MVEIKLFDYEEVDPYWGDTYQYVIGMGDNTGANISRQIEAATGQPVKLRISSVGGYCDDALQIVNAIQKHGNVTGVNEGVSFSAAAIILASCQTSEALKYTLMMIHNSRTEMFNYGTFTAEDLRKFAEQSAASMDAFDSLQRQIFIDKTGLSEAEISDMLSQETYMTSTEAQELGFVNNIIDGQTQAINRNAFAKAPMRMVAMANKNLKIKENPQAKPRAKAEDSKFKKGDAVELLADHMDGMKGMTGKIATVNNGYYYSIDLDDPGDMKNPHKWMAENEIEDSKKPMKMENKIKETQTMSTENKVLNELKAQSEKTEGFFNKLLAKLGITEKEEETETVEETVAAVEETPVDTTELDNLKAELAATKAELETEKGKVAELEPVAEEAKKIMASTTKKLEAVEKALGEVRSNYQPSEPKKDFNKEEPKADGESKFIRRKKN